MALTLAEARHIAADLPGLLRELGGVLSGVPDTSPGDLALSDAALARIASAFPATAHAMWLAKLGLHASLALAPPEPTGNPVWDAQTTTGRGRS